MLRWLVLIAALVLAAVTVSERWDGVRESLGRIGPGAVLVSVLAAATAVTVSAEQQRALLGAFGHRLPLATWLRVFWVAQLGKYVPGTAWAYVAQMELSRRSGVRRTTSVAVIALGAGLTVLTATVVAVPAVAAGRFHEVPGWLQWALSCAGAAGLAVLVWRPDLVQRAVSLVVAKVRRLDLSHLAFASGGVRRAVGWSVLAWLAYGLHLWAVVRPLGMSGPGAAALALGTFALAWVCGFLFVIAPAGAGVREAVMVALLSPELGPASALAVALASRFLIMVAELLLTLAGLALRRQEPSAQ